MLGSSLVCAEVCSSLNLWGDCSKYSMVGAVPNRTELCVYIFDRALSDVAGCVVYSDIV